MRTANEKVVTPSTSALYLLKDWNSTTSIWLSECRQAQRDVNVAKPALRRAGQMDSPISRLTTLLSMCGLTFELRGRSREGAWPARRMMTLDGARAKRLAGGGPARVKGYAALCGEGRWRRRLMRQRACVETLGAEAPA